MGMMEEEPENDWRADYQDLVTLPTGELAGLKSFMFTVGLCVGLHDHGYRVRYCYPSWGAAEAALKAWDGFGDPSGLWIKAKWPGSTAPTP